LTSNITQIFILNGSVRKRHYSDVEYNSGITWIMPKLKSTLYSMVWDDLGEKSCKLKTI